MSELIPLTTKDYKLLQAEADLLRAEVRRINNLANCGSVDNWMTLSDEQKREWFAVTLHVDSEKAKIIREQADEIERLREEVQRLSAVSAEPVAWQSIETAPKDGTVVLVCQETEPGFWEFEQAWWSPTWGFGGGNCTNKPTHWMPLLSPPSNAAMQKDGA